MVPDAPPIGCGIISKLTYNTGGITYCNCNVESSNHAENIESKSIVAATDSEKCFVRKFLLDVTLNLPGVTESNVSKADRTPNEKV